MVITSFVSREVFETYESSKIIGMFVTAITGIPSLVIIMNSIYQIWQMMNGLRLLVSKEKHIKLIASVNIKELILNNSLQLSSIIYRGTNQSLSSQNE